MLTRLAWSLVSMFRERVRKFGKREEDLQSVLKENEEVVNFVTSAFCLIPRSRTIVYVFNAVEGSLEAKLICASFASYILSLTFGDPLGRSAKAIQALASPPSRLHLSDEMEGVDHSKNDLASAFGVTVEEFSSLVEEVVQNKQLHLADFFGDQRYADIRGHTP